MHHALNQRLQRALGEVVIRVNEGQQLTFRHTDACITGSAKSAILLVHHLEAAVTCHPSLAYLTAFVGRAIIHHNHLAVIQSLRCNALQTPLQRPLHFIYRYYDAQHDYGAKIVQTERNTKRNLSFFLFTRRFV